MPRLYQAYRYYKEPYTGSISFGAEAFLTNDMKLKQIADIKVLVLKDYL
jgi:hypothetical protein